MGKQPPKMTALVVSAIRNLREVKGSTPNEILNYIIAEYNATNPTSDSAIQRKLCTALKRGLEYGILKQVHGHYSLNTDSDTVSPTEDMLGPMERGGCGCKGGMKRRGGGRRRGRRGGGRKGCKSGGRAKRSRKRRRRGGAGCGPKRRRGGRKGRSKGRGKGGCKSRSRRARRAKSRKCGGKKRRPRRSRRAKSKCATRRGNEDVDILAKDPIDSSRHRDNIGNGYTYDREERRSQSRGRQSVASRSRSPSRSRSSGSSDREGNEGDRRDRQVE